MGSYFHVNVKFMILPTIVIIQQSGLLAEGKLALDEKEEQEKKKKEKEDETVGS